MKKSKFFGKVDLTNNPKLKIMLRIICLVLIVIFCSQDFIWAGTQDKKRYDSKDMLEFISRQEDFMSGKFSFEEFVSYILYLNAKAELYKIDLKQFPILAQMLNIQQLQFHTDFDQAEVEGQVLSNTLTKTLCNEDLKEMAQKDRDFKSNKITDVEYYTYIEELSQKAGLSLGGCPNFTNYIEYIKLTKGFKEENLFRDIEAFNATIISKYQHVGNN